MAKYDAQAALPNGEPGAWGTPVTIRYDQRDVLLYAVGIGLSDLRYVYEGHPDFAVFPTFSIRWGGAGAPVNPDHIPHSPGPLNIDAERYLEVLAPLPTKGEVSVKSRLVGAHPRGKGAAFCEYESIVSDAQGNECIRLVNGSFRRGVAGLGDIEPFEGSGITYSQKITLPDSLADVEIAREVPLGQAHVYRLSGDYNPLHIDPDSAKFGGFEAPIMHGLCTLGFCSQLLLQAICDGDHARFKKIKLRFSAPVYPGEKLMVRGWHRSPGRTDFEARVGDRVVVSNAYFEWRES
ncbi:MAG: MaoC/PaaZ C-terminal domain-containing protein [Gammaproteobacteria bacterium]|nr:MaoC/PaaZ C-terminal domain-containing protein [Gammaproteobacteria bacterium]